VNLNVRINNRCSKDVTLTRLRLNTCARCTIGEATGEDCGGSFSILDDLATANGGVTLEPNDGVDVSIVLETIQLSFLEEEGDSNSCDAYNFIEYDGGPCNIANDQKVDTTNSELLFQAIEDGV